MKELIRRRALELGFDLCGFGTAALPDHAAHYQEWLANDCHGEMTWMARNATRRMDPEKVLEAVKTIIAVGVNYGAGGSEPVDASRGVVARYARFDDYHRVLKTPLLELTTFINELGGSDTRSLWYVDTGPVLERDLAQRAGIGFVGKHNNLISRQHGNWIFLAEILTTLSLAPDLPERNRCGTCSACIQACPTRAITGPFQLDARRCISYFTIELKGSIPLEFRRAMGNRIYGCDDCLEVCPWNRFAREARMMKRSERADLRAPDLLELLALDESAFKSRFAGTPLLRTKRHGLLRNVAVALGNVGDATALPALERAARDPDPHIAEHADWGAAEIRRRMGEAKR